MISALAGYSLSRFHTPAQKVAGAALLLTKMLPGSLIVIPFFVMFTTAHLIDSRWGLIVANVAVGVPFATWMMKGFFDTLPRELEQAAAIDGCTPLQALWYVILPLARPGLAACGIYLAIVAWSEFVFARTLVTQVGPVDGDRRPAVVRRRVPGRLAGADGRRRRVARADVHPVPAARAVPRVRADVGGGEAVAECCH